MSVGQRFKAAWRLLTSRSFVAAETNRLTQDWITSRSAPDDELRWSIAKIRARARDLERNNPLVRQFLRMLATNVIGPDGIKLQSQIRNNSDQLNEPFNTKIEDAWREWSESPMRDGKMDLNAASRLALKTIARDGEIFIRKIVDFRGNRFGFAIEMIDPDLIDEMLNAAAGDRSNEIRLGIEMDSDCRPVAYHGWNLPPALTMGTSRRRVVYPADQIIHLYDPDRINQTRGVSWMTPVLVPMRHLGAYTEAELIAARTGASKMGFFQRKQEVGVSIEGDPENPGSFTMNADPGTFGILPDGYEVANWTPDHPSTAFSEFIKSQIRNIAAGLGVSYNSLANDLESVNYSSIRSGLLSERDIWRTYQDWWICSFLKPLYREWLNVSLLTGAVKLDNRDVRKFLDARWIPRGWAWVDPLKDTQAGVLAIKSGLASRTSLLAEQGVDFEDVINDLEAENIQAELADVNIDGDAGIAAEQADQQDQMDQGGGNGAATPARNGAHSNGTATATRRRF